MARPPASKEKVLQAAEKVVQKQGAGSLTYEKLVQESGVSRGGITYHFPTKDLLLKALIERDIQQWDEMEKSLRPRLKNEAASELIGKMRAMTRSSEDQKRFVSGLLSAISFDPEMLEPVRKKYRERCIRSRATTKDIDKMILELAAAGIFWQDVTRCQELDSATREKLISRLEKLAKEWTK